MQWFYNLKTIYKMCILIAAMAIGMISIGFTGFYFNQKASINIESMYRDKLMPVKQLNLIRVNFNANNANTLSLLLIHDNAKRQSIKADMTKRTKNSNELLAQYEKTNLDPYEEENLPKFKNLLKKYRDARKTIISLSDANRDIEALNFYEANVPLFKEMVKVLEGLTEYNTVSADKMNIKNEADGKFATALIIIISIIALIFCTWLGWLTATRIAGILGKLGDKMKLVADGDLTIQNMGRPEGSCIGDLCVVFDTMLNNLQRLVKEVNKSVQDMHAGTEEMNAAADQTAQGAQQTAASVQQLAMGSQQVSQNVQDSAENLSKINVIIQGVSNEAIDVAKLGNETETNANEGRNHVKKAVNKIDSIRIVSGEISDTINELGKLSSEIETIVDLIKNISGQTNLLALNAAIEAARAGEHGKGFAVVADEVKKLAGQSGEATDKITKMIKEIQNKTQLAVTSMDKGINEVQEGVIVINDAGTALENIIDQVKQANSKIQGINKEIDGVAKNSDEVVKTIENIASVTEETAASAEEMASITEEQTASIEEISASSTALATIAENLNKQVSMFKI